MFTVFFTRVVFVCFYTYRFCKVPRFVLRDLRIGYYDTPSCIYYLILFQCDIFQITYNSHIHNITVDFRCPYTFMPQQLLDCRDIRSII